MNAFSNWFAKFSDKYAQGVTAIVGALGLILAIATLIFLYRDYSLRYRPYVIAGVVAEKVKDSTSVNVAIRPTNVGSFPCYEKVTNIRLRIGDDEYPTPDMQSWQLLGPTQGGMRIDMPAGYINPTGVQRIREARYKQNRIELCFDYETMSVEKRFYEKNHSCCEINVAGETPLVLFSTR